jgi:hypothetical protein
MFAARLLLAQELFDQEFRLTLLGLCGFFPSPRSVSNDITLQPVDYHRRQRLLSKASTRDRKLCLNCASILFPFLRETVADLTMIKTLNIALFALPSDLVCYPASFDSRAVQN